jgi:hypothetical protein
MQGSNKNHPVTIMHDNNDDDDDFQVATTVRRHHVRKQQHHQQESIRADGSHIQRRRNPLSLAAPPTSVSTTLSAISGASPPASLGLSWPPAAPPAVSPMMTRRQLAAVPPVVGRGRGRSLGHTPPRQSMASILQKAAPRSTGIVEYVTPRARCFFFFFC